MVPQHCLVPFARGTCPQHSSVPICTWYVRSAPQYPFARGTCPQHSSVPICTWYLSTALLSTHLHVIHVRSAPQYPFARGSVHSTPQYPFARGMCPQCSSVPICKQVVYQQLHGSHQCSTNFYNAKISRPNIDVCTHVAKTKLGRGVSNIQLVLCIHPFLHSIQS